MKLKWLEGYSKGRIYFLIFGSLFHGGMVFTFKAAKGSLSTAGGTIYTIGTGIFAGVLWGFIFHLITMKKIRN